MNQTTPPQRMTVAFADIDVAGSPQARAGGINEPHLEALVEAAAAGDQLPPPILCFDGDQYHIADGNHRVLVAKHRGQTEIEALVHNGTRLDALIHALGANSSHGLPRSQADKRHAIGIALREFHERTDSWIAGICKVSNKTVAVVRAELEFTGEIPSHEQRLGGDGRLHEANKAVDTNRLAELEDTIDSNIDTCHKAWLAIASIAVLEGRELRAVFHERRPEGVPEDTWETLWGFFYDEDFAHHADANSILPTNVNFDEFAYRAVLELDGAAKAVVEMTHDDANPGFLHYTALDIPTGDMVWSQRPFAAWSFGSVVATALDSDVRQLLTAGSWRAVPLEAFESIRQIVDPNPAAWDDRWQSSSSVTMGAVAV